MTSLASRSDFNAAVASQNRARQQADSLLSITTMRLSTIRPAAEADEDAIWRILEPVFRAGETYTVPPEISRKEALAYWRAEGHEVFVAEHDGEILGAYFLQPNQKGGGSHVANCGYVTASHATGQGIARHVRAFPR